MDRPSNVVTLWVVPCIVRMPGVGMVVSPTRAVLSVQGFKGRFIHNGYVESSGDVDVEVTEDD